MSCDLEPKLRGVKIDVTERRIIHDPYMTGAIRCILTLLDFDHIDRVPVE